MPTTLPQERSDRRRAGWGVALKFAMVVSVLLLGALVQITEQVHFAAPHHAMTLLAATLEAQR
jgi:hypothetical protein